MQKLAGAVMAVLVIGTAARAEGPVVFDLSIRGIEAAVLSLDGTVSGSSYAVTGRIESAGLLGLVRKVRYEGTSRGKVRGTRFTPSSYTESADTGRRRSAAEMRYTQGVPQVKSYDPPRAEGAEGLDPASQGGTVDPLTAMFAALRDRPAGQECNLALTMFDGERRSQVVVGAPLPADGDEGGLTCPGEYRRLEGFSAEDMAERTRFPFVMTVSPVEDGMRRVTEVRMETLYGRAVMTRR